MSASQRLSMEGLLKQARLSLEEQIKESNPSNQIPRELLRDCEGIALITTAKVGLGVFGGSGGTGIVIGKTDDNKWSFPVAVGCGGASFGFQWGASKSDIVMILTSKAAVQTFLEGGQIKLGTDLQVAAGPVGRDAGAGLNLSQTNLAPVLSYSHSKGLYAGVSLEGNVLALRNDCNADFYGAKVEAKDVISGKVKMPKQNTDYDIIIELLNKYAIVKNISETQKPTSTAYTKATEPTTGANAKQKVNEKPKAV